MTNPKSLAQMLDQMKPGMEAYEDVALRGGIEVKADGDGFTIDPHMDRLGPQGQSFVQYLYSGESPRVVDGVLWAHVLAGGPKVFRPTVTQLEMLENAEPRIPIEDYRQPFPVMVVEIPEDYQRSRVVPAIDPEGQPIQHAPYAVVLGHFAGGILASAAMNSGTSIARTLRGENKTIEEVIQQSEQNYSQLSANFQANDAEQLVSTAIIRAGINAMLLLSSHGCRLEGPANPGHFARLDRFVDLARKKKDRAKLEQAERELRAHPQVYGFEQDVLVHAGDVGDRERGDPTGATVKPHWRRGHLRMQAHGAGYSLRKLIFVRPVLVNAEAVAGKPGQTRVNYRIGE